MCWGKCAHMVWGCGHSSSSPLQQMGPDYITVVKKNIDVQTISSKLQSGQVGVVIMGCGLE